MGMERRRFGALDRDVSVVGYAPFGHGQFPRLASRVPQEIAAAHDATPCHVALRFLLRLPALFTIPELARIDAAFPLGCRRYSRP
jgi:diketogulonate reductase-like aldo/keto reductase